MKNILITGGNGYIAKSIYSALHTKHNITTITRQDFDLTCWVSTNRFFKDKSFDIVIHTATSGGSRLKEEIDSTIRENLLMYRNLLNHRDKFTKFISFGSGAELSNPTTPYGISKQMIADSMSSKPNFLNIRIFAVFDDKVIDRVAVDGWKDVAMVAKTSAGFVDDQIVDRAFVDGLGGATPVLVGASLRALQNGKVQRYMVFAVVALMALYLFLNLKEVL